MCVNSGLKMRTVYSDEIFEAIRWDPPEGVESVSIHIEHQIVTIHYKGRAFGQMEQKPEAPFTAQGGDDGKGAGST